MTIRGTIHTIFQEQKISEKFRKREFVIELIENPLYPQYILFQFVQDKCDMLNRYQVGNNVDVDFNLRGRSWESPQGETKYFNTLEAWKITPIQGDTLPPF